MADPPHVHRFFPLLDEDGKTPISTLVVHVGNSRVSSFGIHVKQIQVDIEVCAWEDCREMRLRSKAQSL